VNELARVVEALLFLSAEPVSVSVMRFASMTAVLVSLVRGTRAFLPRLPGALRVRLRLSTVGYGRVYHSPT